MRWFADNSELNGIKESKIPDILLFGGIAVSPENERPLRDRIELAKSRFCSSCAPIKWNFKDLKKVYSNQKKLELYEQLLKQSKKWRREIFSQVSEIEFTIIISCIESYSSEKKIVTNAKEDLTKYVFSNALMRFALHVSETNSERAEVILDWPDKGDSKPFDVEYAYAYNHGKSHDKIPYKAGSLKKLNFLDSAVYTNMNHSTLLQFSDLVVGATREFIECALGKKSYGFGIDMLKIICSRFRGAPNRILGRGIIVSSGNAKLKSDISAAISRYLKV